MRTQQLHRSPATAVWTAMRASCNFVAALKSKPEINTVRARQNALLQTGIFTKPPSCLIWGAEPRKPDRSNLGELNEAAIVVIAGLLHSAACAGVGMSLWLEPGFHLEKDTAFPGLDNATYSLPFGSPVGADRHVRLL
ncbi:hypothetical protein EVAR_65106_1 [Eumeta japonica]|uniref:Uncharacterized protein n=1 Tax=Eumeta variegata TaxID=151549 RepID=A0A4C1ZUW0_EUMVA|nr:hypothetical protein EVAR_65106_1 [Eumeta japonica]